MLSQGKKRRKDTYQECRIYWELGKYPAWKERWRMFKQVSIRYRYKQKYGGTLYINKYWKINYKKQFPYSPNHFTMPHRRQVTNHANCQFPSDTANNDRFMERKWHQRKQGVTDGQTSDGYMDERTEDGQNDPRMAFWFACATHKKPHYGQTGRKQPTESQSDQKSTTMGHQPKLI